MFKQLLLSAAIVGSLGLSTAWSAIIVSPGYSTSADTYGGTRLREFGNNNDREVYVGVSGLGSSARRNEIDLKWTGADAFSFSYDALGDQLTTRIDLGNDGSVDKSVAYGNWSTNVLNFDGVDPTSLSLNYIQLDIAARESTASIHIDNLTLDGNALGSFSAANTWNTWNLTNLDLSAGFELSGVMSYNGINSGSAERSKVQIGFGHDANAPTPGAVPEPASIITLIVGALLARRLLS